MGLVKKDSSKSSTSKGRAVRKNPRCKTCGKVIRLPRGWSVGPAVRRHYWSEHREIMQPARKEDK
jgi:hypothetical protein